MQMWERSDPVFSAFKIRHSLGGFQSFVSFGHLSRDSAQAELAICTWRPFIFRRPICGTHGALLGHNPSLGSSPVAAKGRDKNTSSIGFIEKLFLPPFPHFFCLWSCKQSLTSSCTHLTPDPSDKAHSAVGATSRGSSYSEIQHHNGLRLIPAFSELCPPNPVRPHTPLFFSAVDGAWEYLLFSCCCQQFWVKQQELTAKSCIQIKGGINLMCHEVLERKSSASLVCLIFNHHDFCELK